MQYTKFARKAEAKVFSDNELNNAKVITDFDEIKKLYAKNGVMIPMLTENKENENIGLNDFWHKDLVSAEIIERYTKDGNIYYRLSVEYSDASIEFRLFGSKDNDYIAHTLSKDEMTNGKFIYCRQNGEIVKEDAKNSNNSAVCAYRTYFVLPEYLPAK